MDSLTGYLDRAVADGGTGNAEVVRELEARLAQWTGARHAFCVSSGTAALVCALKAVGVTAGSRVAVSCLAPSMTALAVLAAGAEPVFLDSRGATFGVDASGVDPSSIAALIVVPMWGYWAEDAAVLAQLRQAGVPVIIDAAQAPFLRLDGGWAAHADVVCLSLHGRKPIKAGEGGVCLTDSTAIGEAVVTVRNFGQKARTTGHRIDPTGPFATALGANYKMNALGAAWCLQQLDQLPGLTSRFADLRETAHAAFRATGIDFTEAGQAPQALHHGGYGLVAVCPTPDHAQHLARALDATGVEVDSLRYQYAPAHNFGVLANYPSPCPNADAFTRQLVACRLEAFTLKEDPQ